MHRNRKVKILSQEKNRISIAPFEPQEESVSLASLKREIAAQCAERCGLADWFQ